MMDTNAGQPANCSQRLRLFEIASVFVRFDHVASIVIDANHRRM
jgi:hypothetical protein